jgi:WbqC-like protein family
MSGAVKTIAIMQPTFLPWVGYFALMELSDAFVFLDSVQFAKRSWQQRNQIKTAQGVQWLTVPVATKGLRDQLINQVKIESPAAFAEKTVRTLSMVYGKTPFFGQYAPELFAIFEKKHESLSELNVELVLCMARQLGIERSTRRSSEFSSTGRNAELLANLCVELGYGRYLSAVGSREYIEQSTAFRDRGIEVAYNPYVPTPYRQAHGDFVPYMSAVDLIFNVGPESLAVLREGLKPQEIP